MLKRERERENAEDMLHVFFLGNYHSKNQQNHPKELDKRKKKSEQHTALVFIATHIPVNVLFCILGSSLQPTHPHHHQQSPFALQPAECRSPITIIIIIKRCPEREARFAVRWLVDTRKVNRKNKREPSTIRFRVPNVHSPRHVLTP